MGSGKIPKLLFPILLFLSFASPIGCLFGLRRKPKPENVTHQASSCPVPFEFPSNQSRSEPWVDEHGNFKVIRAVQDPSGAWRMPEGTIVPKDPQSMKRIIEVFTDTQERFHCVLLPRKRPYKAQWLDIPQVPVVEDIRIEDAERHLRPLEGKCFYRVDGWWTYEFCYKSHVRQFHMDIITKKITQEYMLGHYNASNPFEIHNRPERLEYIREVDVEGPAWTSNLVTAYGGGELVDMAFTGSGWYAATWSRLRWLPLWAHEPGTMHTLRPRHVAVMFGCLELEDDNVVGEPGGLLKKAQLYLDGEEVPFDVRVFETGMGVYELRVLSKALCASDLLRRETQMELNPVGNVDEEVECTSLTTGKVYKLKDVPSSGEFPHKFRNYFSPFLP